MKKQTRIQDMALLRTILSTKRPSQDKLTYAWMDAFMAKYLDYLNPEKDIYNNHWLEIKNPDGTKPTTAFVSHYDTVHRSFGVQSLIRDGDIMSAMDNGLPSILGADDGVGMFLMIQMIKKSVPGLYVFFADEESGCIGSSNMSRDIFEEILVMISFDRKGTNEVITHQCGERCASNLAGNWLAEQLGGDYRTSDLGAFTDSMEFADTIPECFNLAVGYYNQHTTNEHVNLAHINMLVSRLVSIDWEQCPIGRVPKPSDYGFRNTSGYYGYNTGVAGTLGSPSIGQYGNSQLLDFIYFNPKKVERFLNIVGVDVFEIEDALERYETSDEYDDEDYAAIDVDLPY